MGDKGNGVEKMEVKEERIKKRAKGKMERW